MTKHTSVTATRNECFLSGKKLRTLRRKKADAATKKADAAAEKSGRCGGMTSATLALPVLLKLAFEELHLDVQTFMLIHVGSAVELEGSIGIIKRLHVLLLSKAVEGIEAVAGGQQFDAVQQQDSLFASIHGQRIMLTKRDDRVTRRIIMLGTQFPSRIDKQTGTLHLIGRLLTFRLGGAGTEAAQHQYRHNSQGE